MQTTEDVRAILMAAKPRCRPHTQSRIIILTAFVLGAMLGAALHVVAPASAVIPECTAPSIRP